MSRFDTAVQNVLRKLQEDPALTDIRFVAGYSPSPRPNPLHQVTAAVALQGAELTRGGLGGYLGTSGGGELTGSRVELSVCIAISVPPQLGGDACADVFSRVCASLMLDGSGGVRSVTGDALRYDAASGGFRMDCTARLRLYWGQSDSGPMVERVTVKGVTT